MTHLLMSPVEQEPVVTRLAALLARLARPLTRRPGPFVRSTSKMQPLRSIEGLVVSAFRTSRLWRGSAPRDRDAIRFRR